MKYEKKLNTKQKKKVTAFRRMNMNITPKIENLQRRMQMRVKSEWPWDNSKRLTHKYELSREIQQSSIQRVGFIIRYNFSPASLSLQEVLCRLRTELRSKH